jgi:HEAT repeat protein
VVWTYDPSTLAAVAPVAADKEDSKLEYIAWTLTELADPETGDKGSAKAIAALLEHPAHFVRWTAVRTAMALDEATGRALLARASEDPHVHVRNAARRALEQLAAMEGSDGADP